MIKVCQSKRRRLSSATLHISETSNIEGPMDPKESESPKPERVSRRISERIAKFGIKPKKELSSSSSDEEEKGKFCRYCVAHGRAVKSGNLSIRNLALRQCFKSESKSTSRIPYSILVE